MRNIPAPLCDHCGQPMTFHSERLSGQRSYYCRCVPCTITWRTIHPDKEIPRVKRTGYIPQGE